MKSFKYTINCNVYKVHISSVVDDIAEVEVNGTPYQVKMEKPVLVHKDVIIFPVAVFMEDWEWRISTFLV